MRAPEHRTPNICGRAFGWVQCWRRSDCPVRCGGSEVCTLAGSLVRPDFMPWERTVVLDTPAGLAALRLCTARVAQCPMRSPGGIAAGLGASPERRVPDADGAPCEPAVRRPVSSPGTPTA